MEKKKILVINVNWVGDVLFSTPFIRALREAYPDSHIACLLHPRCKEALYANPRLDEIIIYDEEGKHKSLIGKIKLINILKKKRFDTAFILHRSFTKALIAYLALIGERIGYATKNRSFLLTRPIDEPIDQIHPAPSMNSFMDRRRGGAHKVEYFLNLARAAGISAKETAYEFFIEDSDRKFIKDFLRSSGISDDDLLIALCPGGNWDQKRWPKENFAKLGDLFIEKRGAKVVVSGAQKDLKLTGEIRRMMKNEPIIACGKTTLKQLGALVERASLVVANDSGPMHIAVSMKTKTIALFGPTSPAITGPYGSGNYKVIFKNETCQVPCYDFNCMENRCMSDIKVDDVFEAAEQMLCNV